MIITIYVNNIKLKFNKPLTVLQACNTIKVEIPKFCFQENLQIAGNCRMCLVEIENSPKPIAACAMPITNNMKIFTNTALVQKARESVLEFILINHPLDCPICDQASECDLQDQTLIFGLDKTRFFFNKRVVEDKYCGPFIKTIMTRCIHCTRCVRFAEEISNIDNLGTTGRGKKTEINFYSSNIFKSEFSGNLIDLCPVGALTLKPFSFKFRSWELKNNEGIDVLDSIGSNIKINVFNNEIIRILPKSNNLINKEWISNKTRFFFDSLKYQRIQNPLLKTKEGNFKIISWFTLFKLINYKTLTNDASNFKVIIGNLTDLESIFLFKKFLNKIGIDDISYENYNNIINSDLTSNFIFKNKLKSIESSDLCLIVNTNIREEFSILNIHLINRLKKGNYEIAYIGNKIDFTYPITHLGTNLKSLINIFLGKHFFCKKLKKAKNPLILFGENIINQKNGYYLFLKFQNFNLLNKKINLLITQTSLINTLETSILPKKSIKTVQKKLFFLYNTNLQIKLKNNNAFLIYQGHHFTKDAQRSNLIIPGLTFLEKAGTYINIEGRIQKNYQFLNLKTQQRKDSLIYKYLFIFLISKNQTTIKNINNFLIQDILIYLRRKNLKITKNITSKKNLTKNNTFFFNSLIKNYYYTTILEQYSKILINSKKILKNNNNFIDY